MTQYDEQSLSELTTLEVIQKFTTEFVSVSNVVFKSWIAALEIILNEHALCGNGNDNVKKVLNSLKEVLELNET